MTRESSTGLPHALTNSSLLKILRLSTSVTSAISTTPFFHRLADSLSQSNRAVVKLNLLRLTRVVCDNHPDRATLVSRFDLAEIVDRLAKQDEAILVRELAKEIYPSLLFGNDPPVYHPLDARVNEEEVTTSNPPVAESKKTGSSHRRGVSINRPSTAHENNISSIRGSSRLVPSSTTGLMSSGSGRRDEDDKGRHKRRISRSLLKDLTWQTDENGRLKSVRAPSNST